jgi:hypothetical protein
MNIKSRLKRMQSQIIGNDSEFCDCEKETKFIVFVPTEDGRRTPLHPETYEPQPERCETCNKPNAAPFEFTFTINPNVTINE